MTQKQQKNKQEKEIVVANNEKQVEQFIQTALNKNLPVETMERLFTLREKVKAETAKEAFVEALSKFQEEVPVIVKNKEVKNRDGSLRYKYAPLDDIIEQIKESLKRNGLSYTWETENKEELIKATARITHVLGHTENSSFEVPVDSNQYMTSPQRYASALTFAKRYALCNALGISTGDEDTDAVDVNKERDAKNPKARIMFLLRRLGKKNETKEQVIGAVKRLTKLTLTNKNFQEIINRLEALVEEEEQHENT